MIDIGAPFGGVETYICNLALLLRTDAEVFCICALPELAAKLRPLSVPVVCVPILRTRWSKIARFAIALPIMLYLLLRYRIRVVQVNGYLESMLMLPARLVGCTTIRTAHGPSEIDRYQWYRRPEMFFPRLASLYCLPFASRIVCVSEAVRADVLRVASPSRVSVVSNWIANTPSEVRSRRELHVPARILYVGRLAEYKGVQLILEAARHLPGLEVIIVGDGPFRHQLEEMAQGLLVTFTGFLSNPSSYYVESDVLINPSYGPEGLPIVSLEAMGHGVPCLFSDLPVHREISRDGRGASLFRAGDGEHLRQCLSAMLGDAELRCDLAASARQIIAERYSPHTALAGYRAAFGFAEGSE